nr:MAG TPA: hypothetical protein [Caudoviricetes sp.]
MILPNSIRGLAMVNILLFLKDKGKGFHLLSNQSAMTDCMMEKYNHI